MKKNIENHSTWPQNLTLTLTLCVQNLLKDPLYMGLRIKRTRGKEYDDLIDEFMSSCVKRYNQSINQSIDHLMTFLLRFNMLQLVFAAGSASRFLYSLKTLAMRTPFACWRSTRTSTAPSMTTFKVSLIYGQKLNKINNSYIFVVIVLPSRNVFCRYIGCSSWCIARCHAN